MTHAILVGVKVAPTRNKPTDCSRAAAAVLLTVTREETLTMM